MSGSKVRIESTWSSNRSTRYGTGEPIGIQVDQAAAHRVFARRHDLAHVAVPGQRELGLQRGFVEPRALLEVEGGRRQETGRRQPRQRGGGRQQHHVEVALQQAPQRGEALGDQVLVRREGVVGQRLPIGEHGHAQIGREEQQLVGQALRVGRIGGQRPRCNAFGLVRAGQAREQQRIGRAGRQWQRKTFAGGDAGQLHGWRWVAIPLGRSPGVHRAHRSIARGGF